MRERTPAVHVAQRPDALGAGTALVVHRDVATRVGGDAGLLQTQVIGVRLPADCEQKMAALGDGLAVFAFEADDDAIALPSQRHALGAGANGDAFALEDGADFRGDVLVLTRQQLVEFLDHRHLRTEAPVHLRELQADVAAADDHQVLGHPVNIHHGGIGEVRNVLHAGNIGHHRPAADVDEDFVSLQGALARIASDYIDGARPGETRLAPQQRDVLHAGNPGRKAVARLPDDAVLARLDGPHVDLDVARTESVLAAAARHMDRARAADQRLGGNAADVDAGAAEQLPLDDGGAQAFGAQARGKRGACLPGTDDDGIVAFDHAVAPWMTIPSRVSAWSAQGFCSSARSVSA